MYLGPRRWLAARSARWTTWRIPASHRRTGGSGHGPTRLGSRRARTPSDPLRELVPSGRSRRARPDRASEVAVASRAMERPTPVRAPPLRSGDKRNQVVHDVDACDRPEVDRRADGGRDVPVLRARHAAEARNRGYRLLPALRVGPRPARRADRRVNGWFELRRPEAGRATWPSRRPVVPARRPRLPGLVLCHGFPVGPARRPPVGRHVPRADRPHRQRDGLGRR